MTTGILAAVLALLLLCGCGANRRLSGSALDWLQLQGQTQADEMPPFDQIVYERPDVSGL